MDAIADPFRYRIVGMNKHMPSRMAIGRINDPDMTTPAFALDAA